MNNKDFTTSILVEKTPAEAFAAINNVQGWWAKNFEGSSQKLNDVFTVRFGETFVTFKITEFMPGNNVVWTVTDCNLHWQQDKTEWTGTTVIFEIRAENNLTTISFTHQGLVPQVECYNNCVEGWTEHIKDSLLPLLTEGKGQPS